MKTLAVFGVTLCFLAISSYAQDEEGPYRVPTEVPSIRGTLRPHRVTGGAPRVTAIPSRNNEEGSDDLENTEPSRVTPGSRRFGLVTPGVAASPEEEGDLGNDETPMVTGGSRGATFQPANGNTARVTGRPLEVTTKRCAGCPIEINHDDENIQKYARNATEIYKRRNEIPRDAVMERVYDVKRQVINGLRYNFKIVYSYSLAGSNIKNMATCDVEVLLHHTLTKPRINANPCKKPRSIPIPEGPMEEEIPEGPMEEGTRDAVPELPVKPVRGWF